MKEAIQKFPNELAEICNSSFGIACNANDFFAYACADMVLIDIADLKWVLPIYKEFGFDGLYACLSHIAGADPIKPYITDTFLKARAKIVEMAPTVVSEY